MRFGIISHWFPPEPAFVPGCLADELVARGHQVRVLTSFPSHPGGHTYPGFRQRWWDRSVAGGLTIRRVPSYPTDESTARRRLASQLSFLASGSVAARALLRQVDALYVYAPSAGAYAATGLSRLVDQVPAVVHVQDLSAEAPESGPDPAAAGGRADRMERDMIARAMRRVYDSAAGIAVIAPSMRDLVIERGADPDRVRVVLNWTDERYFRPARPSHPGRRAIGHRGRCTVMHAGTIGPFQRADVAVRAAAELNGKVDLDLVLVGSGAEERRTRQLAAELGADNVRFVERRPPAEMADLYGAAEYQLVMLRDLPALRGTVPAKLPAALSAGAPVVASAGGDTADLVERDRAGLSCPPEDWRSLADRFALAAVIPAEARAQMARRARESYLRRMSLRRGVDQIERMLIEAAAGRGGGYAGRHHRPD
nr:glycosyltransferase family 4 protein [Micromonospora sp. DSM 115978]